MDFSENMITVGSQGHFGHAGTDTSPKRTPGGRSARPILRLVLSIALGLLESRIAAAQTANPLFEQTSSPAIISQQVRMALPSAERALRLLNRDAEPAQLQEACQAILDTYKYLRAAQESTDLLARRAKFPDPSAQMEMKRMWEIRMHMIACNVQAGHIVKQNQEMIDMVRRTLDRRNPPAPTTAGHHALMEARDLLPTLTILAMPRTAPAQVATT